MKLNKPILAIETSQNLCGVCLFENEQKFISANLVLKNSHSEKLFDLIDFVLLQAKAELKDLSSIAVSIGPGSFTGLRIGLSAAKGLAYGVSLPIIPVPTFEALALQISGFLSDKAQFVICNKINRDELYFAKFKVNSNNYIFTQQIKIIKVVSLNSEINSNDLLFGNAFGKSNMISSAGKYNIISPYPEYIAKWAREYGQKMATTDFDNLEPNYLKEFLIKEKN